MTAVDKALATALVNNWPGCVTDGVDGESYAQILHLAGLAERREVVTPCDSDACVCEPGDLCWFLTETGKAALAGPK